MQCELEAIYSSEADTDSKTSTLQTCCLQSALMFQWVTKTSPLSLPTDFKTQALTDKACILKCLGRTGHAVTNS